MLTRKPDVPLFALRGDPWLHRMSASGGKADMTFCDALAFDPKRTFKKSRSWAPHLTLCRTYAAGVPSPSNFYAGTPIYLIDKLRSKEDGDWSCVPLHKDDRLISAGGHRKKRCALLHCFAASCS